MALIYCPECGKQISDKAVRCPNCGRDMTQGGEVQQVQQQTHQPMNQYGQQPMNQYGQQQMPPCPKTYLVESILVTIFCCVVFGVLAIVKAAKVSSAYSAGNYDEALEASEAAKKWVTWGFICGIIVCILAVIGEAMK